MDPQTLLQSAITAFQRTITQHYFDFEGRVGRAEFWFYVLAAVGVQIAVEIVDLILGMRILGGLLTLALILPNLGMGARRLHDVGKSAWLLLLPAIPALVGIVFAITIILIPFAIVAWLGVLAASVYLIYLYAQPGMTGPNQFGPEPAKFAPAAPAAT